MGGKQAGCNLRVGKLSVCVFCSPQSQKAKSEGMEQFYKWDWWGAWTLRVWSFVEKVWAGFVGLVCFLSHLPHPEGYQSKKGSTRLLYPSLLGRWENPSAFGVWGAVLTPGQAVKKSWKERDLFSSCYLNLPPSAHWVSLMAAPAVCLCIILISCLLSP